ncbi:nucleotide pyrophosphohydrolase [candidate division WWE3 bacterium CG_4_10_14_0_2_um_filter_42_8]|uniref:Nucleotide pyrophosphohydrolase n=1 Tax=candidate division WWE3 bacterium CG_4_10_14_0_2_um_filter_42_8 TaxID=1975074 RepID=A0A2M7T9Z9_UNCKA|nr:MAG: nucleotide pyrophosphohydrolase [candidate division WWE3 bacterium CG_4_10_14_0_2_um_filter_42_8]
MAKTLQELQKIIVQFRDERGWKKHHKPKNLAISISVEAAELLEHFQWGGNSDIAEMSQKSEWKKNVMLEMADVLIYMFSLADALDIDLEKAVLTKNDINKVRFPKETVKDISLKSYAQRRKAMQNLREKVNNE